MAAREGPAPHWGVLEIISGSIRAQSSWLTFAGERHDELEQALRSQKLSQIFALVGSVRGNSARAGNNPIFTPARCMAWMDLVRLHANWRAGIARSLRNDNSLLRCIHLRLPANSYSGCQRAAHPATDRNDAAAQSRRQIHRRALHIYIDVRAQCPEPHGQGSPPVGDATGDSTRHSL